MANTKISALTAATTPLAGTEVLPIVQSGSTVKVSVANLTAGRAVASAGGTFSDNFVQGTAAKGVNFTANTPAAGMTSQLLNWYEEGTWTPTIAFATNGNLAVTYSDQIGRYTRIGRQVTVSFWITTSSFTHTTASGVMRITGCPFNAANTYQNTAAVTVLQGVTKANYTCFGFYANAGSSDLTSSASGSGQGWDNITAANMPTGGTVYIACTLTYFV